MEDLGIFYLFFLILHSLYPTQFQQIAEQDKLIKACSNMYGNEHTQYYYMSDLIRHKRMNIKTYIDMYIPMR